MTKGKKEKPAGVTVKRYCEKCRYRTTHFKAWESPKLKILVCGGCEATTINAVL